MEPTAEDDLVFYRVAGHRQVPALVYAFLRSGMKDLDFFKDGLRQLERYHREFLPLDEKMWAANADYEAQLKRNPFAEKKLLETAELRR
jgi:hypothetical protein